MLTPRSRAGAGPDLRLPGGFVAERVLARRPGRVVARARRPGDTSPVVVKATTAGAGWRDRAALRREARLLDALAGAGVVELVEVVDRRGTALALRLVPPGRIVDVDAATALVEEALDRFAASGLAHDSLDPAHVLIDECGRPVVCGLGHLHRGPAATPGSARRLVARLAADPV